MTTSTKTDAAREAFEAYCETHPELSEEGYDFVADNPHVLRALIDKAYWLKRQGYNRGSIVLLVELVRYDAKIKTTGDPYKIDNTLRPWFARLIMALEPKLKGFFETRTQG